MIFLEVLTEGSSDVPAVKEILTRRFNLKENEHFRIHPCTHYLFMSQKWGLNWVTLFWGCGL